MSSNTVNKKSGREGTATLNSTKRVQRSVEGAKQLFPKECTVLMCSGTIKIKYKKIVLTFVDPANIS